MIGARSPAMLARFWLLSTMIVSTGLFQLGCSSQTKTVGDSGKTVPAKVERASKETELGTVILSDEAASRLGIALVRVEEETVTEQRLLSGESMIPMGKSIVVSSPVAGTITKLGKLGIVAPGSRVKLGDPLLTIAPLLSPERDVPTPAEQFQIASARANLIAAQTIAAGDYDRSSAEAMVAKIAVDRTEKLFQDRAGSQRAIDDARGLLQVALSVQHAAEQRKNQLTEVLETLNVKVKNGTADAIPLTAPQSGIIRTVFVSEGQAVTSGTQLFEILDFSSMWIRVPVFVDQLNSIVADAPARITGLDGTLARLGTSGPGTQEFFATPIAAPPSADAIGTTADLYFAIDNTVLGLRPGQRVGVHLQTSKASVAIIVPYASIVYDIHGDTWIYRSPEKNKFVRQRVDIRFVDGPRAVLHSGPKVGDSIVVDGVAELFGTEFGTGK